MALRFALFIFRLVTKYYSLTTIHYSLTTIYTDIVSNQAWFVHKKRDMLIDVSFLDYSFTII
jgi:hypothetical protein